MSDPSTPTLSPDALAQIARLHEENGPGEPLHSAPMEEEHSALYRVLYADDDLFASHLAPEEAEYLVAIINAAPALIAAQRTLHQIAELRPRIEAQRVWCEDAGFVDVSDLLRDLLARLTPQGTPQE